MHTTLLVWSKLPPPYLTLLFNTFQSHRKPRVDRINADSRKRGLSKTQEIGPVRAWFCDRFTRLVAWWMRDTLGKENYEYRVPGYDTLSFLELQYVNQVQ
jgi:hypothetical protein